MEIEEANTTPNHTNFKRCGLKNSYKPTWAKITSSRLLPIKLYSTLRGQYLGESKGHSSTINQISYAGPCVVLLLVRAWDTRSFQQLTCISAGRSDEVFSFSFGVADGNLLAGGCKSQILFWDWRKLKRTACLEDSHIEDVTQVHFVPGHQNKLLSASVDGLMCLFDTSGDINDDDHLVSDWVWVMGGTNGGTFGYVPVKYDGSKKTIVFHGGHTGIARSVLPMLHTTPATSGWTAGEDGRLCSCPSDESVATNCVGRQNE